MQGEVCFFFGFDCRGASSMAGCWLPCPPKRSVVRAVRVQKAQRALVMCICKALVAVRGSAHYQNDHDPKKNTEDEETTHILWNHRMEAPIFALCLEIGADGILSDPVISLKLGISKG